MKIIFIIAIAIIVPILIVTLIILNPPKPVQSDYEFLKDPVVRQSCLEAHEDLLAVGLPDLDYCRSFLG